MRRNEIGTQETDFNFQTDKTRDVPPYRSLNTLSSQHIIFTIELYKLADLLKLSKTTYTTSSNTQVVSSPYLFNSFIKTIKASHSQFVKMQFPINLIIGFTMATRLMASPLAQVEAESTEVYRETVSNGGSLVYYSAAGKMRRTPTPMPAEESNGGEELFKETTSNGGSLVYYGASKSRRSDLIKRIWPFDSTPVCVADVDPTCDNSNGAPNDVCAQMVAELEDNGHTEVPQSSRQICFFPPKGDPCCVSWGTTINDFNNQKLTKADLYNNANKSKY